MDKKKFDSEGEIGFPTWSYGIKKKPSQLSTKDAQRAREERGTNTSLVQKGKRIA